MFTGAYNHTMDTKGRLMVPPKFREALGNEFWITKGLDGCLFVFTQEEWQKFEEKLRSLPLNNEGVRRFVRFFAAGATSFSLDKQGRVLLPGPLREFAGLDQDNEIVMAGMLSRIEIWSKTRWNEHNDVSDMNAIAEQMADLGMMI
ncbi:MAG: division/cell wall cluster transcriptional repressor MraZ [Lachnospiraceae bacterium]|nr:division/cell wall cluster transcriptional repressor MraZ [Lachnospiraceae bacterium]